MAPSKTYLWICLALCVGIGESEVFFTKIGQEVKMDCGKADHNQQLEWKHNGAIVVKVIKTTSKGSTELAKKAKLSGSMLKVPSLGIADSGEYVCNGYDNSKNKVTQQHTVYAVSVSASPSPTVLHSTDLTLTCDIHNNPKVQIQWMKPSGKPYESQGKAITLKSVTSYDYGTWTCQIKDNEKVENMPMDIKVLGPLTSPAEVTVSEGGSADLTCSLPSVSLPHIKMGGWSFESPNGPKFPTLKGGPKWEGQMNSRVTFPKENLNNNFTVTLMKVKSTDEGKYTCSVKLDEMDLTTSVKLKVTKEIVKNSLEGKMWIWVGTAAALVLLIGLVIIIVLINRRNKRMRRKVRKMKSMRQGLTVTNYCQCERPTRQPHPGKRERPPPLPRYQYDIMD